MNSQPPSLPMGIAGHPDCSDSVSDFTPGPLRLPCCSHACCSYPEAIGRGGQMGVSIHLPIRFCLQTVQSLLISVLWLTQTNPFI